jgi:hypothetical protein
VIVILGLDFLAFRAFGPFDVFALDFFFFAAIRASGHHVSRSRQRKNAEQGVTQAEVSFTGAVPSYEAASPRLQSFFNQAGPGGPHRLDDDEDGLICEFNPWFDVSRGSGK